MRYIEFSNIAFDELNEFKTGNQKLILKILDLIKEIQKSPFSGIGKPEPLKGQFMGYWSRRINKEHRLVYKVVGDKIIIIKCSGHYNN